MLGGAEKNRFLAKVRVGAYRAASRSPVSVNGPRISGTIAEHLASLAGTPQEHVARSVLLNKVKVCPTCGKPNGFTLATCNKCQQDLLSTGTSFTNNLFSAFVLGIEREPKFPLKLSIRLETERLMVFDDPLALSPLHFCAIPTTAFIPDWRHLLLRPQEGLTLSQELVRACHTAAQSQFLSNAEWRRSLLKADSTFELAQMVMGYNFPPSQNQLHVQYMLPLLMPHQFMMFLRGVHFTPKRFFPISFVEECLQRLIERGTRLELADLDRPVEELLEVLKGCCGVDYDYEHALFLAKVEQQQLALANWSADHFGGVCRSGGNVEAGQLVFDSFDKGSGERSEAAVPEHTVYDREKGVLQNYGKCPTEGDLSMGYYSYAKSLDSLDMSFLGDAA